MLLERPNGPKASFVLEAQKPFFEFFLQNISGWGGMGKFFGILLGPAPFFRIHRVFRGQLAVVQLRAALLLG